MIKISNNNYKLTKKEIKKITNKFRPQLCIGSNICELEKFKQVCLNGVYFPYIISSAGRIISINYCGIKNNVQFMNPYANKGYYKIAMFIDKKGYPIHIHRLVALMFVKNKNPKINIVVNHIDGNTYNNFYRNLEWCTYSENTKHAYDHHLIVRPKGESSVTSKYTDADIHAVCKLIECNTNFSKIHKLTGVSKRAIRHIIAGDTWKHISEQYDFTNYRCGKSENYIEHVKLVCELLAKNEGTLKEISNKTCISYAMVKNILNGKAYKYISDHYDISNFNNFEVKRR